MFKFNPTLTLLIYLCTLSGEIFKDDKSQEAKTIKMVRFEIHLSLLNIRMITLKFVFSHTFNLVKYISNSNDNNRTVVFHCMGCLVI